MTSDAQHRDLGATLPSPLKLHLEEPDPALRWVRETRADPTRVVLPIRKAVYLWTPPKLRYVTT